MCWSMAYESDPMLKSSGRFHVPFTQIRQRGQICPCIDLDTGSLRVLPHIDFVHRFHLAGRCGRRYRCRTWERLAFFVTAFTHVSGRMPLVVAI